MTDLLRRNLAPLTDAAWEQIDEEARRVLRTGLSGRALVDFSGPHGWTLGAVNTGRLNIDVREPIEGVKWAQRVVLPLIEVRTPFRLKQLELDYADRGADDIELGPLREAAQKTAAFEDGLIYNGFQSADIHGVTDASPHEAIPLGIDVDDVPMTVAMALETLRVAGIDGPYGLVLSSDRYHTLRQTTKTGYPLYRVVRKMIGGPIHWSPAVDGGILLSLRGGDFELTVGQDLSIGYACHDMEDVELYFTESLAFRVLEPGAAVTLSESRK